MTHLRVRPTTQAWSVPVAAWRRQILNDLLMFLGLHSAFHFKLIRRTKIGRKDQQTPSFWHSRNNNITTGTGCSGYRWLQKQKWSTNQPPENYNPFICREVSDFSIKSPTFLLLLAVFLWGCWGTKPSASLGGCRRTVCWTPQVACAVLRQECRPAAEWRRDGYNFRLAWI